MNVYIMDSINTEFQKGDLVIAKNNEIILVNKIMDEVSQPSTKVICGTIINNGSGSCEDYVGDYVQNRLVNSYTKFNGVLQLSNYY